MLVGVAMTIGLVGCCLAMTFFFLPSPDGTGESRNSSYLVYAIKLELVVCTDSHMLLCGQNLFLLGCNCGYNMSVNCSELWLQHERKLQ